MTIKRGTTGSGITEQRVLSFDDEADKADPEIAAAMERATLEGWIAAVERECFAIMAEEGLPTYHGSYLYDALGNWREPGLPLRGSIANEIWPVAQARGFLPDSKVGFAARMLGDIVWMRRAKERGDHDRAALFAGYLKAKEVLQRVKTEYEATWQIGKATRLGGHKGAEARKAKLEVRNQMIRESYRSRRDKGQDAPTARRHTATKFYLSPKQVGRIIGSE